MVGKYDFTAQLMPNGYNTSIITNPLPYYPSMNTPSNRQRTSSYHWRKLRMTILERDKFTCQNCGVITTVLEVDHIIPNSDNNDPSNLQALCRPCHEAKTLVENKRVDNYLDSLQAMKEALYRQKNP